MIVALGWEPFFSSSSLPWRLALLSCLRMTLGPRIARAFTILLLFPVRIAD
jgi:hypothetical protein